MNYSIFLVKIISNFEKSFFHNDIEVVETIVQFPTRLRKKPYNKLRISIWGNLSKDLLKYYKIGDYIIVEGSLSIRKANSEINEIEPELTVAKLYPFLLME